ncbi:cupin domain-containing protein [Streptomyces sp. NBC_01310]|uniref:cupin domain-containing protein n=1 Tax=Streptomyces sp. NBC_01310 TaxID=2903820 RepID=UPI0035B64CE9|nr:cupin domain-containing protein [Streptomyces sp. NBC_01310]
MTTQTHERRYFPAPDVVLHDNGVRHESYRRDDTEVRVAFVPPGVVAINGFRAEAQVGMVVRGELSVTVDGVTKLMRPEHDVYVVPPNVGLTAVNPSSEETVLLEITRSKPGEKYPAPDGYFLEPLESRKFVKMDVTFFLADWIELMVADIPGGGHMPYHKHSHEQIGICLDGRYDMTVEETSHELRFGGSYFCASQEGHSAENPHTALARSLNIFIPPRYHRVPKPETEQENP